MKLYRAFRDDRLLRTLTVTLTLAAWLPLFVTPFLPLSDLPNNAAAASMLFDAATAQGTVGHHYHVSWVPTPYWTGYVVMAAASAVGGVLFAAKAIVALLAIVLPLSVMRLLIALGRSPRLGLWAFAIFWDHNLYSGWVTYLLGMAIALYALARLMEVETRYDGYRLLPWTVLVALTHAQAVALLAMAGVALTVRRGLRGRPMTPQLIALAGGAVPALAWVRSYFARREGAAAPPWAFDWHPWAVKAGRLYTYTFDHYPPQPAVWAPAFAFTVLILGPLFIATLIRPQSGRRERTVDAAIITLSCVALYATLPFEIRGPMRHFHNYPRYATFVLLTMLLVPNPDLRGWRALALVPGVVAAVAMDATVLHQFRRFADHSRVFLQLMDAVPRGSRVLPLINVDSDPACAYDPYNQFHSYLTAVTRSYDPYLFDNPSNPLQFTASHRPDTPPWAVATDQLSMERQGKAFDYILVQGLARDPFQPGARLAGAGVHVVAEGGIWRLYAVDR
jgi:hypothetical protein